MTDLGYATHSKQALGLELGNTGTIIIPFYINIICTQNMYTEYMYMYTDYVHRLHDNWTLFRRFLRDLHVEDRRALCTCTCRILSAVRVLWSPEGF